MNESFFNWVSAHMPDNPTDLRLRFAGKPSPDGVDIPLAILQVECRRKCARKLASTLRLFPEFIFPTALSAEQCSSDTLAGFHADLVPEGARTGVDLTAGLGIDVLTLCRRGLEMTAIERSAELADALRHNASGLTGGKLTVVNADCREWLETACASGRRFDLAFIDPARRSDTGGRLFALEACSPDVTAMLPRLAGLCKRLVIKASPMLDVSHTATELTPPGPTRLIAAGTATECKELIAVIDFESAPQTPVIETVTLLPSGNTASFSFTTGSEHRAGPIPAGPGISTGMYIHEPYPATMKSGAHRSLAAAFGLYGFAPNTRLYYSEMPACGFPGESFKVRDVQEYSSRNIKRFASSYPSVSVTARNFGLTAENLRRKLGVKEGDGHLRLFALTDAGNKRILVVCQRI